MHGFRPSLLTSYSLPILPTQKSFLPLSKPLDSAYILPKLEVQVPATEARLIQVRKSPTSSCDSPSSSSCDGSPNSSSESLKEYKTRAWELVKPERGGISISQAKVQKMNEDVFGLPSDVLEFLLDLAGKGGLWEGWNLHAVSDVRAVVEEGGERGNSNGGDGGQDDTTPCMDVVFVREKAEAMDRS